MTSLHIGTDIVELSRIQSMVERHGTHFIEKVYSSEEQTYMKRLKNPTAFLSGRWAAKEAIYKLLDVDLSSGVAWRDISIVREKSGAPRVTLFGKAKEVAASKNLKQICISISHCRSYAIAYTTAMAG